MWMMVMIVIINIIIIIIIQCHHMSVTDFVVSLPVVAEV
jgi:hypothetical protein